MTFNKSKIIIPISILIIVSAAIFIYHHHGPGARERRRVAAQAEKANLSVAHMEEVLRADTYGGRTPEDTIQMLIAALEEGDIELASKYFALNLDTQSSDYLTRREWEEGLRQAKEEERIQQAVELLDRAVPDPKNRSYQSDYKFAVYDANNEIEAYIDLELNKYSGAWKIESL